MHLKSPTLHLNTFRRKNEIFFKFPITVSSRVSKWQPLSLSGKHVIHPRITVNNTCITNLLYSPLTNSVYTTGHHWTDMYTNLSKEHIYPVSVQAKQRIDSLMGSRWLRVNDKRKYACLILLPVSCIPVHPRNWTVL
jgi:hypothetical protein